jgi:hypothetical protein
MVCQNLQDEVSKGEGHGTTSITTATPACFSAIRTGSAFPVGLKTQFCFLDFPGGEFHFCIIDPAFLVFPHSSATIQHGRKYKHGEQRENAVFHLMEVNVI